MFNPFPSDSAKKYALEFINELESGKSICDFNGMFGILVCRKKNDDGTVAGYGCQFQNTDQRQEGLFAKFVYNIQLQERIAQAEKKERLAEGLGRIKGNG